jgi:hypothetical protein
VDKDVTVAITAISDGRVEGSIAAALNRLGWSVLYRATSLAGLQGAVTTYPQALIVASDDFRGISEVKHSRLLTFHSSRAPLNDIALHEMIHDISEAKKSQSRTLKLSGSKIYLVASSGRSVGASTIALNLAREISTRGSSTLLLDCNHWSPYLSRQLSINGINREIARTSFGLNVGEIATSQSLTLLAPALDSFDHIVIDFGQLRDPAKMVSGKRVDEEILRWAMHSKASLLLVSRSDARAIEDLNEMNSELGRVFPEARKQIICSLTKVLSARERSRLIAELSLQLGERPRLISREQRYIAQMEDQRSTLLDIAPKSLVLSELRELIEDLR